MQKTSVRNHCLMHPTELNVGIGGTGHLRPPVDLQGSDSQELRPIIADEVRIVATGAK
jgi:hypothetical protein